MVASATDDPVIKIEVPSSNINDQLLQDAFLNACTYFDLADDRANPRVAMAYLRTEFEKICVTDVQVERLKRLTEKMGVQVPRPDYTYIHAQITVPSNDSTTSDPHLITFKESRRKLNKDIAFKDVANEFSDFIFGTMLNDGVHGGLGKKQNILPRARDKKIILEFPGECYYPNAMSYGASPVGYHLDNWRLSGKINAMIKYLQTVQTLVSIQYR
jgi:hypothetical protein